ncbi:MAG TPA: protein-glutamate O-methyltransferase CheR [Bacteroidales bacterium]|nr:protein-glutamate O-methyltransferase CheR [Bacteroidales bacterium]
MDELSIVEINRITESIKKSQGIDFSNYAFSSLRRRLIRFIEINKIRDINNLIHNIMSDKSYADRLIEEITVNVTEMFRDPSFWVELRDRVLQQLAKNNSINIWIAACSTGEEVLSMTIMLREANLLGKSKILATDINHSALEVARKGKYKLKNQENNSKNYQQFRGISNLSDYFEIDDDSVQFDLTLTGNVEFRQHDLTQGAAGSSFDLILCRNVLIYFNSVLQDKVINSFHHNLSDNGFLAIGSKESIQWCKAACYFREESFDEKIYMKISGTNRYNSMVI